MNANDIDKICSGILIAFMLLIGLLPIAGFAYLCYAVGRWLLSH